MSKGRLTEEQESKLKEIQQEWVKEVEEFFDAHKDDEINTKRLGGLNAWALAAIQMKYKKKINEELGMDFYEDVVEKKRTYKKFSDSNQEKGSGIINYLRTDKELLAMRKEWKEAGIGSPFPPFNYDEYDGIDGYKKKIREQLNDFKENR